MANQKNAGEGAVSWEGSEGRLFLVRELNKEGGIKTWAKNRL